MANRTTTKKPSTYYQAFCWSCKRMTDHQLEARAENPSGNEEVCKDPKHDHSADHGKDDD